ncbi:hypothetical protein EI94DRAFT_1702902 [Lactarius quietus]|nr:hypothetical protein EI94DRAFT_1702902 [Lactarius quietus]
MYTAGKCQAIKTRSGNVKILSSKGMSPIHIPFAKARIGVRPWFKLLLHEQQTLKKVFPLLSEWLMFELGSGEFYKLPCKEFSSTNSSLNGFIAGGVNEVSNAVGMAFIGHGLEKRTFVDTRKGGNRAGGRSRSRNGSLLFSIVSFTRCFCTPTLLHTRKCGGREGIDDVLHSKVTVYRGKIHYSVGMKRDSATRSRCQKGKTGACRKMQNDKIKVHTGKKNNSEGPQCVRQSNFVFSRWGKEGKTVDGIVQAHNLHITVQFHSDVSLQQFFIREEEIAIGFCGEWGVHVHTNEGATMLVMQNVATESADMGGLKNIAFVADGADAEGNL